MKDSVLHIIPAAKRDLQDIWLYTLEMWGAVQAERYVTSLKEACNKLVKSPFLGKALPDLSEDVRVYYCQCHYIFYLKDADRIVFLAFLHEKRNVLQHVLGRLPQ